MRNIKHQVEKKNCFAKTSKELCGLLSQYHKTYTIMEGV